MISKNLIDTLIHWFHQIYDLGSDITLFSFAINDSVLDISLNSFLIALAVMSIILTSLLTFVRAHGGQMVDSVDDNAHKIMDRINRRNRS